jgi:hypothetical protein
MTTVQIFKYFNKKLLNKRIPKGNEALVTTSIIDPNDVVFNMSFEEILSLNRKHKN